MSEKGKIIIRKNKKGKLIFEVDIGKKQPMLVPAFYNLKEELNGKECEVYRENGKIVKITVDGNELPKTQKSYDKKVIKPTEGNGGSKKMFDIRDSLNIEKTKLPFNTRETLKDLRDIDNFNLKLNKAARFEGDKFSFFKTDKGKIVYQIKPNFSEDMIDNISERYYSSIRKLNLKLSKELKLKPDWRLIVGLGNESVYETSMTLHHIYGIPYIPGSAIKGVVRNYIITEEFGKENDVLDLRKAEKRALQDRGFCDIFGCPKESFYKESRQGKVIFFDAYPMEPPKIEPDVINVHYPDYYGKNKPPADYQNPNPTFFLTVKDTEFKFILGMKEKENNIIKCGIFKDRLPLEVAYEWMKKALSEHGIGAKTAVGYGYMK